MSETSQSQAPLSRPPEDLHWGIVYLREDIQDLRGEIRAVHTRLDQTAQELRSEIQGNRSESQAGFLAVHARLDQTTQELRNESQAGFLAVHNRIDQTTQELRNESQAGFLAVHTRIDQTNQRLDERFEFLLKRLDERFEFLLKRLDNRFLWMITTMIALSGIIVTIFKM